MPDSAEVLVTTLTKNRKLDWEVALGSLNSWLKQMCEEALGEGQDRTRLECHVGRIKESARVVDKIRRKGHEAQSPEEIEEKITDLVATKILCKSTRDQKLIDEKLRNFSYQTFEIKERTDYVTVGDPMADGPKKSGYRAVHYLFQVPVLERPPVVVELQIKTRLQDAWGELTHEDLYKPGQVLDPDAFEGSVGRIMANLLAQVDELADELACSLEKTLASAAQEVGAPLAELPERIIVRTVGPRYALAVTADGVGGLISAAEVQRYFHETTYLSVDEFLTIGQELQALVRTGEKGTFFELVGE